MSLVGIGPFAGFDHGKAPRIGADPLTALPRSVDGEVSDADADDQRRARPWGRVLRALARASVCLASGTALAGISGDLMVPGLHGEIAGEVSGGTGDRLQAAARLAPVSVETDFDAVPICQGDR